MAKNRFINTKFWSDSFVSNLNPLDRYLFLYFLTNEHTNIAGIYELPIRTIMFETKIGNSALLKILNNLEPKVYYVDGWVYVRNFERHQRLRGSQQILIGIENAKKEVPEEVLQKILEISQNPIGYAEVNKMPIGNVSYLDLDLDLDIDMDFDRSDKSRQKSLAELIEPFKTEYSEPIIQEFLEYWTEKNPNSTKERWQMEKIFDPSKRLKTWARNAEKWGKKPSQTAQRKTNVTFI